MRSLICSPHDDDAQLFCCFTAIRTRADIAVILNSFIQPARGEVGCNPWERANETGLACSVLGCRMVRTQLRDDRTSLEEITTALTEEVGLDYDVIYAPAFQVGGNEQHNLVSRAADTVFGSKVIHYTTYTTDELYTKGNVEIIPLEAELRLKNEALYCFESQMRVNMPHFQAVFGKSEWLMEEPPADVAHPKLSACPDGSNVPMRLHLGCGRNILPGYINLDKQNYPGVDTCSDITSGIPYPDNWFDYIVSQDLLEHIHPEKKVFVINEIHRILKPGGIMEHNVPNAGSMNDFGSPTHVSHWSLQQFEHWDIGSYRHAKDKEFEGITGGFRKLIAELVNFKDEDDGVRRAQSIHVKYEAVKE